MGAVIIQVIGVVLV